MIAEVCPLPIILYNVPGRTASNISAETTLRLAYDFENIVAVKEASGDLQQIAEIIEKRPANFLVLSGDDGLTSKMIAMGGDGVIAVIGQSHPKDFSAMVRAGLKGDIEKANQLDEKLSPIYEPLYIDGNPAGIKATLNIMGICKNILRPPLVGVTEETYNNLKRFIGY